MMTSEIIKEIQDVKTWRDKPLLRELVMELIQRYKVIDECIIKGRGE